MKKIIKLPHRSLRQPSKLVSSVDSAVLQLIGDMEAATLKWEDSREHEVGVALAAIQVNTPLRVVVIRNDFDNKDDRTFKIYINPKITSHSRDKSEDYEGCLSVDGIYGKVPRSNKVKVEALDQAGKPISLSAEGFLARIFQHEVDHTNGIMFIDHIKDKPEAFFCLKQKGHLEALDYNKDVRDNKSLWQ